MEVLEQDQYIIENGKKILYFPINVGHKLEVLGLNITINDKCIFIGKIVLFKILLYF